MRPLIAAILAAASLAGCASPDPVVTGATVLDRRDDRIMAQLDNGLIVVAQRVPTAPVVSVQCYVKTGLIYEKEFIGVGLSHFLEHLVSGGTTTTRTEDESNEILGRIGASTNAFTSTDVVAYYVDTSAEHADTAVELVSDWMQHAKIPVNEFEREKQVIGREFAMGRGEPNRIFWKLTGLIRYDRHPARHPVIGYEDEFVRVERDDVYKFYKRMYIPNNMVFVVAGDIDPRKTIAQVSELWKGTPAGEAPKIAIPQDGPITKPRSISGVADIAQPRLRLAWPGVKLGSEHDYPLDLLGQILGQGELSRLTRTVRDEQGLVVDVDAYNYSTTWGEGSFGIDATLAGGPDTTDKVTAALIAEVERIKKGGVTDEELARAKRKAVAAIAFDAQTVNDLAGRVASDLIGTGNPDYLAYYAQAIQKVTKEQVADAARKFLLDSNMLTVTMTPSDGPPQPFKRPPAVADDGKPHRDQVVDLDNSNIIARFRDRPMIAAESAAADAGPVHMHRLSNGLRVLTQRNTRLPIVSMHWFGLGGLMSDDAGKEGVANATAQMMVKGAAGRSADDIALMLEERGASLDTSCGNSTIFASAQSLAGDWRDVLGVMAQVVNEPTFDADEWAQLQPRLVAAIAARNDEWYGQVRGGFREAYFGDHPWSQEPIGRAEVVGKLTPDDLKRFHRDHLSAADGVVAIFGDIDEAEAVAEAQRLFGSMPAKAAVPFAIKEPAPVKSRLVHIPTNKDTPAVVIGYGPGMTRANPDYPAMEVMTAVMSSFPVGRLDRRLRGTGKGLVYAVGAGNFAQIARGYWTVLFNTQPPTIAEAMAGALDEVHRIRTEKLDEPTLLRAREKVVVDTVSDRQTNADRAMIASLNELYGLGYDSGAREMAAYHAVTAEDVLRVAQKYLRTPLAAVLSRDPIDPSKLPPLEPAEAEVAK